ncbi:MAG: hypothetical protein U0Z53_09090 [Blastocatellia bacterium]
MRKDNAHSPKLSQVCRLFLLCVALISHVPTYVLGKDAGRTENRSRMQEPVQPQSQSQDEEPREIRQVKKDHPALKIKAIRNHRKKTWLRDMEIEVTNITNRPIYFIRLGMSFPDIKLSEVPVGESLIFGNHKLLDFANHPQPDDPFLKPGESYVFKLPKDRVEVMEKFLSHRSPESALKINLEIEDIRFDDGSGFFNGDTFFRSQPKRVSYYPTGGRENSIAERISRRFANRTDLNQKNTLGAFPGALAALSTSEAEGDYCWGSYCDNRMYLDNDPPCYIRSNGTACNVTTYFYANSRDTSRPCANSVKIRDVLCEEFSPISQQVCPEYKLEGCGPNEGQTITGPTSPDATPTPTPLPACSFGSNPHYICNPNIQRCERVDYCGGTEGDCNQDKVDRSLPCCNDPNQGFSITQCKNNGICDFAPSGSCKPVNQLCNVGEQCTPSENTGGGGDTGGGGGGYCTTYWWVESYYLCNADYSSCYLLGSSVTWAGCW